MAALRAPAGTCACGGGCPRCVQPRLKLDVPGDAWEREAERVADAVVQGRQVAWPLSPLSPPARSAQRLASDISPDVDDAERNGSEGAEPLQRLAGRAAAAPPGIERRLARGGGGNILPASLATRLGAQIGADFSAVRVHADTESARLCDGLGARAFTFGADLYFGRGEYAPQTHEGRRTLAHELAHVVQQGAASHAPRVQRLRALDRSDPATLRGTNVHPWPGEAASGDEYTVQTDAGTPVPAWVAYGGTPVDHRYWCHGFSLGSYAAWGYSVWSGSPMEKVVRDEYRRIPREQARAGDLAVWVLMPDGRLYGHSARFTQPMLRADGGLDTARSRLDTKNGQAALANQSLAEIMAVPSYGYNVAIYRAK